jgi:drug/metabolite transporter (DMT)-like permease
MPGQTMPDAQPAPAASALGGYLLLFSGMALVGSYTALSKPLTEVFPVFLLAWLRFALAAVLMLPWSGGLAQARPLAGLLFAQSFFGNFLFSICMLAGLSLTSASAAGVILATLPAVVALGGHLWLRERLGARGWTAVALAVGGVAVLSIARGDAGGAAGSLAGNLLVLGCVVCEAIYALLGRRLTAQLSPMRISAWINGIGLALMTPPGLWQALHFDFGAVGIGHWLLLAFYSVSASIVSVWLWLSGLQRVPAGHAGVFTIAMPLAATAVGVAVLGESVGWAHAVALVMAVAGILLIAREGRQSPGRDAPSA